MRLTEQKYQSYCVRRRGTSTPTIIVISNCNVTAATYFYGKWRSMEQHAQKHGSNSFDIVAPRHGYLTLLTTSGGIAPNQKREGANRTVLVSQ